MTTIIQNTSFLRKEPPSSFGEYVSSLNQFRNLEKGSIIIREYPHTEKWVQFLTTLHDLLRDVSKVDLYFMSSSEGLFEFWTEDFPTWNEILESQSLSFDPQILAEFRNLLKVGN